MRANAPVVGREQMGDRFDRTFGQRADFHADTQGNATAREGRALALAEMTTNKKLTDDLDASEKRIADDAAARQMVYATEASRFLLDPNASPTNRAKAAKALGVRPQMFMDAEGVARPVKDAQGNPVYDTSDLQGAIKRAVERARGNKLTQIHAMNQATRLYYTQRANEAAGRFRGDQPNMPASGWDRLLDRLDEEDARYGVPADDTTGDDIPAR